MLVQHKLSTGLLAPYRVVNLILIKLSLPIIFGEFRFRCKHEFKGFWHDHLINHIMNAKI